MPRYPRWARTARLLATLPFVTPVLACYTGLPPIDASAGTEADPTTGPGGGALESSDGRAPSDPTGAASFDPLGEAGDGGSMATASGSTGGAGEESGSGTSDAERMCARWNADRVDLEEGRWDGDVATCEPGEMSADARRAALRLTNLYRSMLALPEVDLDPVRNEKAQACALMVDANDELSHDPPPSWACYTEIGAEAAGRSNISGGPGVMSVDLYMVDPGNESTLGHRRWILSNGLGPVGFGSTDEASCMWVLEGEGAGTRSWTAWPSPGAFPWEAVHPFTWTDLDQTGWSLQSDEIDLASAEVRVTADGGDLPVRLTVLEPNYGSRFAISIHPDGWSTAIGETYRVSVTNVSEPIAYEVEIVACEG